MKATLRQALKKKHNYQITEIQNLVNREFIFINSKRKIPFDTYHLYRLETRNLYRSFRNICLFSNRTRAVTKYNIGRNAFRKLMQTGILSGFQKASW